MSRKDAMSTDRRTFVKTLGAATLALGATPGTDAAPAAAQKPAAAVRFGVDMYSLGAQNWTPFQTLDWAAKMNVNMIHFSEVRFLGSTRWQEALAPDNLKRIRDKADELKIDLEIGMRSICPTAADFANAQRNDPTLGTADEQSARMLVAAKAVRSPIVRCVQGTAADRSGPIEKHIDQTVGSSREGGRASSIRGSSLRSRTMPGTCRGANCGRSSRKRAPTSWVCASTRAIRSMRTRIHTSRSNTRALHAHESHA